MASAALCFALLSTSVLLLASSVHEEEPEKVCIVGAGIGGASASYFVQKYATRAIDAEIFERHGRVGGRLAQVDLGGDKFEAGGSIIANRNRYMAHFTELVGLTRTSDLGEDSFGIWDGKDIFFQTKRAGESYISQKWTNIWNSIMMLWRYGTSLFKMQSHISELLERWDQFYSEDIPAFDTAEAMLKSVDLYNLTQVSFERDLAARGYSSRMMDELITVIVRINYGQNLSINGLAGAVALAGSGDELWKVKEGNWRVADELIKFTNAALHLNEEVVSVAYAEEEHGYEVGLASNQTVICDAVILATPLDELDISFTPTIEIPKRNLHHTYTTFVRGVINARFFGAASAEDLPTLIGTIENPLLEFSSISVLKSYPEVKEYAYKVFSREELTEEDLTRLFSVRKETIRIDWAAYPRYTPPEQFAPVLLDGKHLYYINAFESAASAMEASVVAARNVARLLLSRLSGGNSAQVVGKYEFLEGPADFNDKQALFPQS